MRSIWPLPLGLLLLTAPAAQAQEFYVAPYWLTFNPGNTSVTITGYGGPGGEVIIPSSIEGLLITGIGDGFYGCENVTSVTIPGSVTSIGDDAFYYATNLTAINVAGNNPAYMSLAGVLFNKSQTQLLAFPEGNAATSYAIPNSVISIGAGAFGLCGNLTSVTIPSSVTSIPGDGFAGCPRLANVVIPDSVTSIGGEAFGSCGLTNLTIPGSVTTIGDYAFSDCLSLTNITIGDGVTSIGNSTFWETGLTSVTIPDSVTNIANYAFWYSSNLAGVTIGSGVTSIGSQVFSYCPSLRAINVDAENPAYMSAAGVLFDKNQSTLIQYPVGNAATSYSIPGTVATLGAWAFLACTNLDSVTIDMSATNIGFEAFFLCTSLTNIIIPNSVASIGEDAFMDCTNLANLTIGDGLTNFGDGAFAGCASLGSATIGDSVTFIGNGAFCWCSKLSSITIPPSVTSIGDVAFYGTALTNLTIPNSVGSIGYQAFADCTNLANLTIGDGLTYFGDGAFAGCASLRSATIGDSVTFIGNGAFLYTGLTSVTIPSSVTSIGADAFYGTALTTVTIPATVTNIDAWAFESCGNLRTVYFQGNAPALGTNAFTGDNATVYYLAGTTGWSATYGSLPAVALNGITFTAYPINGVAPLTVTFTSPGYDSAGNAITNWNWMFGDGSTSAAQNPSHVYAAGTFYPALFATNSMGLAVLGSSTASINVSPPPGLGGVSLSGANLVLHGSNGLAGATYHLLMSTDLARPLNQWTPVATNILSAGGNFIITLTNAANTNIRQQFYILQ